MYTILITPPSNNNSGICKLTDGIFIPLDPANRHYQEVLDAIIEQGADCFDCDIPADLQAAADEKQFNQQRLD